MHVSEDGTVEPSEGTQLVIRRGDQVLYATPGSGPVQIEEDDVLSVSITGPIPLTLTPTGQIPFTLDPIVVDSCSWLGPLFEQEEPFEVTPHPRTRAIDEEFGWVDAQEVVFD